MNTPFEDRLRLDLEALAATLPVGDGDLDATVARARRRRTGIRVAAVAATGALVAGAALAAPGLLPRTTGPDPAVSSTTATPDENRTSPPASSAPTPGDQSVRDLLLTDGNLVVADGDGVSVVAADGTTTDIPGARAGIGWAWADGRGGLVQQPDARQVVGVLDGAARELVHLDDLDPLVRDASVLPGQQVVLPPQSLVLEDVDPVSNTMVVAVAYGSDEWFTEGRMVTMAIDVQDGTVIASIEEPTWESSRSRSLASDRLSIVHREGVTEELALTDLDGATVSAPWAATWVDDNTGQAVGDAELVPGGRAVALVTRRGGIRLVDVQTGNATSDVPETTVRSLVDASDSRVLGVVGDWSEGARRAARTLVVDLEAGSTTSVAGRATLVHGIEPS